MLEPRVDWPALLAEPQVVQLVELALAEDLGPGDLTSAAIFTSPQPTRGRVLTRTGTTVCGVPLARAIIRRLDPAGELSAVAAEGAELPAGATLFELAADVRAVLSAERCLLNFLMRLCGVADNARAATALVAGTTAQVYDTRKTMPGWRLLDKAAVRTGGACNHRRGLFDAILIKDNHVQAAGSVGAAVARARSRCPGTLVEVEIDRLDQLEEALAAGADLVLLDNFDLEQLRQAVAQTAGRVPLEASGGITLVSLRAVAETGVQRISMGALTHSVTPADLSLELFA